MEVSIGGLDVRALLLLFAVTGCGLSSPPEASNALVDQQVTAGCALCLYQHEGVKGCLWAVEVGGGVYPVSGPLPEDHQAHGPEGMCVMHRRAIVTGEVRHGQFFATQFDLVPADPSIDKPGRAHEQTH